MKQRKKRKNDEGRDPYLKCKQANIRWQTEQQNDGQQCEKRWSV